MMAARDCAVWSKSKCCENSRIIGNKAFVHMRDLMQTLKHKRPQFTTRLGANPNR
jgi:hypothetical protein